MLSSLLDCTGQRPCFVSPLDAHSWLLSNRVYTFVFLCMPYAFCWEVHIFYIVIWLPWNFGFPLIPEIMLFIVAVGIWLVCLVISLKYFGNVCIPCHVVTEQQVGSCCPPPPPRQNSGGTGLVRKERSLYLKATQFWNNRFPHALVILFLLWICNYLISIESVYKVQQHKIWKLHNFGRMVGFCVRACPL